jgi:hypothetical protein
VTGWDDYMDALSALPQWAQYSAFIRLQDMIRTAEQLAVFGVNHPSERFTIRKDINDAS